MNANYFKVAKTTKAPDSLWLFPLVVGTGLEPVRVAADMSPISCNLL
jgi:hypothetical protein